MRTSLRNSRRLWLLLTCWLFSSWAYSQTPDWSTIREADTTYFSGGSFPTEDRFMGFSQAPEPFQLLRMIRVDSQQQTTGGIKLFFPPTIQADAVGMNTCLHLKPGWQGGFCLRQPLGEELFFNRRGDTIQIRTQAALGQPWTLIRDSTGLQIQATLTALGTTAVDGVPDSFRTATLQAYRNGAVVPHAYNGRTLRWSKAHGWLQTLDWYSFPYGARYGFYAGALDDSADYQRLSKTIPFYQGLSDTDVLRKYTPGNEWVFKTNSGNTLNPMASFSYQSDSVIATRRVGNQLLAEIRYQIRLGSQSSGSQSSTLQSGIRTDTIALGQPIVSYPQLIRPDIPDTALLRVGDPVFQPSYFADTLCGGTLRIRTRPFSSPFVLRPTANCTQLMGNLSEMYYTGTDYLVGFGETRRFRKDAPYGIESVSDLLYLRLGTCTYGRPFNVVTLSVTATALAVQPTLYPNPADQTLQIRIPEASGTAVQATILDIQGRLVQTVSLSESITTLSVTDFPASVYIVRFSGITVSQPLKLFIAH